MGISLRVFSHLSSLLVAYWVLRPLTFITYFCRESTYVPLRGLLLLFAFETIIFPRSQQERDRYTRTIVTMKTTSVLLATLASAPTALAHTVWSVLYVDGLSQGDGAAIRMRQDPKFASFPVEDYASDDIACNVDGTKGVNFVSSIKEGSTLTFEMRSWPDDTSKQPLDRPHHG